MRQMTLFELEPTDEVDIDATSEEEIVRMIGNVLGLEFQDKGWPFGWVAGDKKLNFDVKYSYYKTNDERQGKRFIACGYNYHQNGNIGGAGGPCDSVDEAIKFLRRGMERWA